MKNFIKMILVLSLTISGCSVKNNCAPNPGYYQVEVSLDGRDSYYRAGGYFYWPSARPECGSEVYYCSFDSRFDINNPDLSQCEKFNQAEDYTHVGCIVSTESGQFVGKWNNYPSSIDGSDNFAFNFGHDPLYRVVTCSERGI